MKKRRGSPCKHRYSGTCKNLRQGTNKYSPRRRGVDALLSPSSYRISELQVLNTVEVSDNQRLSYYDYYLFTFCFLLKILKGLYYVFFIIRPVVALAHHGFQRFFCTLWWILILLEQSLHHHSHLRPG